MDSLICFRWFMCPIVESDGVKSCDKCSLCRRIILCEEGTTKVT